MAARDEALAELAGLKSLHDPAQPSPGEHYSMRFGGATKVLAKLVLSTTETQKPLIAPALCSACLQG